MRILFVVPYTPNYIRVRPYEFLRALLRAGHEITLATLWTSPAEEADLRRLEQAGATVVARAMPAWRSAANSLLAAPTTTPLQAVYSWHPGLFSALMAAHAASPFDVVHVEHLRGSRYGLALLAEWGRDRLRPPVIWDSVDCISYLFAKAAQSSRSAKSRLMTRFELPRTRSYEGRLVHCFDRTVVTSAIDKAALVALAGQGELSPAPPAGGGRDVESMIEVVPNGVDFALFGIGAFDLRHTNRIVFSGKMSYHANATAALHLVNEIMPAVWHERPDAEVWLVGKDPAPELRALAERRTGQGRVVVTGEVPAMQEYIQRAAVAVAPLLYGAGIQNKVLEAMACATPVVASPQASQSLAAVPGQDFLPAATPAEFAGSILALLQSAALRQEVGCAGRRFVEAHHSWDSAAAALQHIYANAIARRSALLPG